MNIQEFIKAKEEEFEKLIKSEFPNENNWNYQSYEDLDDMVIDGSGYDTKQFITFLSQSILEYNEKIKEMVAGLIVNTPEQVEEMNKDLPITLQITAYHQTIGYTQAIHDIITNLTIKE